MHIQSISFYYLLKNIYSSSSRWKFGHTQLLFKRTGSCQFCGQGRRNITFLHGLLAKNCFVACSQFFLAYHAGSGSCTFAHACFLNLVRWMGIEPTTDCFRGNRPYLMGYQRMCVVYIIVAGQSRLFSKHLPNTIQDYFNHCVADHNFVVV